MEAVIARGIQALIALAGAYLVALWFVLVVWTYRDIETRSKNVLTQIFSTLLVVLFYIPGVLLYMILRPKDTLDSVYQRSLEEEYLLQDLEELPLCLSCQRYVEDDFILCPHCHTTLREPCVSCGRLVHLKWSLCPYCGTEQSTNVAAEQEKVATPAARWRSAIPSVPRRRAVPMPLARPVAPTPEITHVEAPAAIARDFVAASSEPDHARALSVVRPTDTGQTPVRLFDRRKTREAANRNGSDHAVGGYTNGHVVENGHLNGNGNGNGHHTVNGQHGPYLIESQNGNGVHSTNGHADGTEAATPKRSRKREKVGAGASRDGE